MKIVIRGTKDFTQLAGVLGLNLSAAAEQEEFHFEREATAQDVIDYIVANGGVYEADYDETNQVIESIHATAPAPSMLVGDLAQTSVGATGSETQVIGLAEWTIDWKRKTVDASTTDNDTYESSLGSTASWSAKAKYMFIDQDPSQANNILNTIQSPQVPQKWNFFPTIATGRASFSGLAYVDGITFASGMGKVVGLDVSLKGTGPLNIITQLAPVTNANTVTGLTAED